jgi:MFS family permease
MFAPSVPALMAEFHSTNSILGSFVVTVFVLGFAAGPLLFAPLSEMYGRLLVRHIGSIRFSIFSVACALLKNLNTLIGMRLLQGIFAAALLTNGGAIIADMVKQEERGWFTLGILLGSVVGPVCGGFLAAGKG